MKHTNVVKSGAAKVKTTLLFSGNTKSEIGKIRVNILLYTKNFFPEFSKIVPGRGGQHKPFFFLGLMQACITHWQHANLSL